MDKQNCSMNWIHNENKIQAESEDSVTWSHTPGHCQHDRDTVGTACLGHDHTLGHCRHVRDTVSTAGTPPVWTLPAWPGHCRHAVTLPAGLRHCRHSRDTPDTAGTPSACLGHDRTLGHCQHGRDAAGSASQHTVVLAKMLSGQPGRHPAARDTIAQPGRRCADQDAVGSAGSPSGWPGHSVINQDAVGIAG